MSKFIVHKDAMLYTTHGFLSAEQLYNVYSKEGVKKNFKLVGWKPRGETYGNLYSMTEMESDKGFVVSFAEYGRPEKQCFYYAGSEIMDKDMNFVQLSTDFAPFMAVFVQGFVDCTNLIKICEDDVQKFYIIESNIDNIHVNTSVLKAIIEPTSNEADTNFFG